MFYPMKDLTSLFAADPGESSPAQKPAADIDKGVHLLIGIH